MRFMSGAKMGPIVACESHRKSLRYASEMNSLELAQAKRLRLEESRFVPSDERYLTRTEKIIQAMPDFYVITYRDNTNPPVYKRYVVPREDKYLRVIGPVLCHSFKHVDWQSDGDVTYDGDNYRMDIDLDSALKHRLASVILSGRVPKGVEAIADQKPYFCGMPECDGEACSEYASVSFDEAEVLVRAREAWEPYLKRDFSLVNTAGNIEFVNVE